MEKIVLKSICQFLNGYAFKSKQYVDDGIRVIRIANVQKGKIVDDAPCFYPINTKNEIEKYMLFENDLLISLTGNVGRVGLLTKDMLPAALNQRVSCIRIQDKEVAFFKYLYYYLQQNTFERDCIKASNGVAQLNLSTKWLENYEIYLPYLKEQKLIVAKIEELFSKLDKGVEELNKIKDQLKIYRQAVLKAAFEGCLCPQNEKCQIVNIHEIIAPNKHSLKAGPFGSSIKKEMYVKIGYKVYGQEQVISGNENFGNYYIDEKKYNELISCKVKPNDILISLVGTVGKVLVLSEKCAPGIINPRLIKVSLDENKMLAKYFKYYFESEYLRSLYKQKVHGATMDVLNMGMIKELPFPLYSIHTQKIIVNEIETRLSVCDKIEQTVNETLQKAESLRQSILKQAFEGKLV